MPGCHISTFGRKKMIKEGWKGDRAKEGWRHLLSNLDFGNLKDSSTFSAFGFLSCQRGDINYCLEFDETIIEKDPLS